MKTHISYLGEKHWNTVSKIKKEKVKREQKNQHEFIYKNAKKCTLLKYSIQKKNKTTKNISYDVYES